MSLRQHCRNFLIIAVSFIGTAMICYAGQAKAAAPSPPAPAAAPDAPAAETPAPPAADAATPPADAAAVPAAPSPSAAPAAPASAAPPASSGEYQKQLYDLASTDIKSWVYNDLIINAIKTQNAKNADLTLTQKRAADVKWQQERLKSNSPFIHNIVGSQVSNYLRGIQNKSKGLYTELMVVDDQGMTVAQTKIGAHLWQGEQDKWANTFQSHSYAPYIRDVQFNDNTQMFQAEITVMIVSDEIPIGIVYAGVDVEKFDEQ
jgi:hypothetical protein